MMRLFSRGMAAAIITSSRLCKAWTSSYFEVDVLIMPRNLDKIRAKLHDALLDACFQELMLSEVSLSALVPAPGCSRKWLPCRYYRTAADCPCGPPLYVVLPYVSSQDPTLLLDMAPPLLAAAKAQVHLQAKRTVHLLQESNDLHQRSEAAAGKLINQYYTLSAQQAKLQARHVSVPGGTTDT
jgi:hypothetical protein